VGAASSREIKMELFSDLSRLEAAPTSINQNPLVRSFSMIIFCESSKTKGD